MILKIIVSKINHHSENRIRVDFPYNAEIVAKLRQIPDIRWSKTLGAWHIPYTKEAFERLKALYPDMEHLNTSTELDTEQSNDRAKLNNASSEADIRKSRLVLKKPDVSNKQVNDIITPIKSTKREDIKISFTTKRIFVQLPKNETDTQFLTSFRYVHWDNNNRQWIIPNYGKNLELLKSYFQNRTVTLSELHDEKIVEAKTTMAEADKGKVLNIQNRVLRI